MDALPSSESLACPCVTLPQISTLKRKDRWGRLWLSGEAATSCGGGFQMTREQTQAGFMWAASFTRILIPSQGEERVFLPPDPRSLIILWWSPCSKKCYKTEATVSWEKHINSHRGSLRATVKMGTKAGCWPKLPQAFNPPSPSTGSLLKELSCDY